MDYFVKNFLFQLKKGKKKRSRSNDFGSDEYPYSILYSDPRISEYSDTRSSPIFNSIKTALKTNYFSKKLIFAFLNPKIVKS